MGRFILLGIYLVLSIMGLVCMKLGGNSGTINISSGSFNFTISLVSMIGFLFYICSFLMFTQLINMFDLSYIMPISTGIVQICTLIAAVKIFHEEISIRGYAGIVLIVAGIILLNLKK